MTPSECKVCGREAIVLVVTWLRVNGVLLHCKECVECWAKEQKRIAADEEAHREDAQAPKVAPRAPAPKKRRTA